MNAPLPVSGVLKTGILVVYDVIICMLVFSIWSILHLALLPWALLAVLGSLALFNAFVLLSDATARLVGVPLAAAAILATFIFNAATVVFTGVTYLVIRPRWYILITLALFMVYLVVITGLYYASHAAVSAMSGQAREKADAARVVQLLMSIEQNMKSLQGRFPVEAMRPVQKAYGRMQERIGSSTPFGRMDRPDVQDIESAIQLALNDINARLSTVADTDALGELAVAFDRIHDLTRNKEKLILQ